MGFSLSLIGRFCCTSQRMVCQTWEMYFQATVIEISSRCLLNQQLLSNSISRIWHKCQWKYQIQFPKSPWRYVSEGGAFSSTPLLKSIFACSFSFLKTTCACVCVCDIIKKEQREYNLYHFIRAQMCAAISIVSFFGILLLGQRVCHVSGFIFHQSDSKQRLGWSVLDIGAIKINPLPSANHYPCL